MNFLIGLLMAVEILVCLMLIGIILIQKSKGQGLGVSFGAGGAEAVFGGRMGNVLTRTTVILAVLFLANTTLLATLKPKPQSSEQKDEVKELLEKREQQQAQLQGDAGEDTTAKTEETKEEDSQQAGEDTKAKTEETKEEDSQQAGEDSTAKTEETKEEDSNTEPPPSGDESQGDAETQAVG